jgi:hypothetical protein
MSWLGRFPANSVITQAEADRIRARAAARGLTVWIEARMPSSSEPPPEPRTRGMEPEAAS